LLNNSHYNRSQIPVLSLFDRLLLCILQRYTNNQRPNIPKTSVEPILFAKQNVFLLEKNQKDFTLSVDKNRSSSSTLDA